MIIQKDAQTDADKVFVNVKNGFRDYSYHGLCLLL